MTDQALGLANVTVSCGVLRTMGYQQEVVERVVTETGQTEDTFLILEKIVEETKRCEERAKGGVRDRRPRSNLASPEDSSSSLTPSASRVRDERELSRVLVDAGKSKENIKPEQCGGKGSGLGHRRQCSSSEARTQQVPSGLPALFCPYVHTKDFCPWFQAVTIKRSSSAQGGAGTYEVITIDDEEDARPSWAVTASHLDCPSASRMDCLARGGSSASQRDFLLRGGTQTLGGAVKVESVMALRSTPQWLSAAATAASLASGPGVSVAAPRYT